MKVFSKFSKIISTTTIFLFGLIGSSKALLFFPFLAAGLGLPLLGQGVATHKYKTIKDVAEGAVDQLDITLFIVRIFLIFIFVILTSWLLIKLRKLIGRWKFERISELLYRYQTELALLQQSGSFSEDEQAELRSASRETLEMLIVRLSRRGLISKRGYFAKRLGDQHQQRMIQTLKMMKAGKMEIGQQKVLIEHWVQVVKAFLH
jgi:hypothetical protein